MTDAAPAASRAMAWRVLGLALLLVLGLVGALSFRMLGRLPDTTIYLVRDLGGPMTLEPVHRRLRPAEPAAAARATVEALARGPQPDEAARGLASEVPGTTVVRGAWLRDGVLVVDLSADVVGGGGSASMQGRLAQLTYSLTQPNGIDALQLLVEGRPVDAWGGEGIMVAWPWRRPAGGLPRW